MTFRVPRSYEWAFGGLEGRLAVTRPVRGSLPSTPARVVCRRSSSFSSVRQAELASVEQSLRVERRAASDMPQGTRELAHQGRAGLERNLFLLSTVARHLARVPRLEQRLALDQSEDRDVQPPPRQRRTAFGDLELADMVAAALLL